ncbi:hypothetical protein AAC03nite_28050 [Alicyclobacillus acidoterrestris]|nr:hypothetical protein AAC03nite_28050 [Alicyclobacillus acidoterrestris]
MAQFFLSFKNTDVVQLPIPPEKYEIDDPWVNQQTGSQLPDALSQSLNMIGIRGLKTVSIESFFPIKGHDYPYNQNTSMWGDEYVDKISNWRAQRYPIRLVVQGTSHDVNMLVTIDDFKTGVGQDGDISYTMDMTEFIMPKVN